MGLYRILLADDEEEIREGIIKKIDWESLGYTVVGDAENGLDALEKAEHLRPDVVMTDIKMPFMDGLELGSRLRDSMPSTKLILFSGFDDFEYAQKAIKIKAAEYVLKPINANELTETLKKMKQQLDSEFAERRDVEMLRKAYMDSLPVMREQFLVGLIEGRISEERMRAQAPMFQINLDAEGGWAVAVVRADRAPLEGAVLREEELIPISLRRTVDEILGNYCAFTDFLYSDCVAVIAELSPETGVVPLIRGMNEVCKYAELVMGVKMVSGVGTPCSALADIRHSYREAQDAMDYCAVMGAGKAIYISDVEPETSVKLQFDEHDEREISSAIKMGSEEEIKEKIGTLFARFERRLLPLNQYQIYLMEMVTSLLKLMHAYELSTEEIFGENFNYVNTIAALRSPVEMKQWCTECCIRISMLVKHERINSTRVLAQNAKQYIAENFQNPDLSVDSLCSFLHVSPTYFSTVFKRETGMSFVAYLTEVRLQEAVNLLNTTDDKTYIIAGKVGYTEPNYFSYVFKKKFGVSPSKYRNQ
ncbi:response regulator [Caproiciproducens galactitolivorans]|uniref:Stage 0 sporulation protein A homolog n=1 Tax=Caproiciproducens galactitolivorans TaxID=642589 RepID=A0A4Z0YBV1_9FIRM|nr:response regulator [Caproiciproducens galactitolivorans]QEY34989.1 response regulator [Caproiciproducens galactitolivorans]TGJ76303.1 putative response regulatory protein [Caproiciproducens galactitolivorans]